MKVCRIAYLSEAVGLPTDEEVDALASQASRNNELIGVTGCLLYSGGNYIQVLEGPCTALMDLFSKIESDARHTDVRLLLTDEVESRAFDGWSMGCLNTSKREAIDHQAIGLSVARIKAAHDDEHRAQATLDLLAEFQSQLPAREQRAAHARAA